MRKHALFCHDCMKTVGIKTVFKGFFYPETRSLMFIHLTLLSFTVEQSAEILSLILYCMILILMTLRTYKKFAGKGKNIGNQHFSYTHKRFLHILIVESHLICFQQTLSVSQAENSVARFL